MSLPSLLGRWWLVAGLLLICGGGLLALPRSSGPPPAVAAEPSEPPAPAGALPVGALARLGETRFRHGMGTSGLVLSRDGKVLASSGHGRAVCLWDTATGKLLRDLSGPNAASAYNVALSPAGRQFVPAMYPLRIFDAATGKVVRRLTGHTEEDILAVDWSDDGRWVASSSSDRTIRIWDAASGEQRHIVRKRHWHPRNFAFAPGSMAFLSADSARFFLLDLTSGVERALPGAGKGAHLTTLAFSGDGKTLALVHAWPRGMAQKVGDEPVHGAIRLWDVDGKSEPRPIRDAVHDCDAAAFTPDSRRLALGFRDGGIGLVDVSTGKVIRRWSAHADAVTALAFSPDGKVLYSGGAADSVVRRWDPNAGRAIGGDDGHDKPVTSLRYHADGKALVSVGPDRRVIQWDLATGKPAALRLPSQSHYAVDAVVGPEGKLVAMAHDMTQDKAKGTIDLYDARTGDRRQVLEGHDWRTFGLAFDHQGKRFARAGRIHGDIKVWDVATGKIVWQGGVPAPGPAQARSSPHFSRDGRLMVVGGFEPVVHLLDAETGKTIHRFEYVKDEYVAAFAADFSPDGQVVAFPTSFSDTPIVLLETATGKVRRTWRSGQNGGFTAVEFSPDGRLLATASHYDHLIKLWDAATGAEMASFASSSEGVLAVAFSSNGRTLASGCSDSTILLWDVTGRAGRAGEALTTKQLRELWNLLANEDAKKAYAATWELALSPGGAAAFLRERVSPVKAAEPALVDRLVKQLGSNEYAARETATRELEKLGAAAIPRLRKARESGPDLEAGRRVEAVIAAYTRSAEWQRQRQALAALERGGGQAAWKLVEELAGGADGAPLTEEARAILKRRKQP